MDLRWWGVYIIIIIIIIFYYISFYSLQNDICGHIYPDFTVTTHHYIYFIISVIHNIT